MALVDDDAENIDGDGEAKGVPPAGAEALEGGLDHEDEEDVGGGEEGGGAGADELVGGPGGAVDDEGGELDGDHEEGLGLLEVGEGGEEGGGDAGAADVVEDGADGPAGLDLGEAVEGFFLGFFGQGRDEEVGEAGPVGEEVGDGEEDDGDADLDKVPGEDLGRRVCTLAFVRFFSRKPP